jgi:hypothetical protein
LNFRKISTRKGIFISCKAGARVVMYIAGWLTILKYKIEEEEEDYRDNIFNEKERER